MASAPPPPAGPPRAAVPDRADTASAPPDLEFSSRSLFSYKADYSGFFAGAAADDPYNPFFPPDGAAPGAAARLAANGPHHTPWGPHPPGKTGAAPAAPPAASAAALAEREPPAAKPAARAPAAQADPAAMPAWPAWDLSATPPLFRPTAAAAPVPLVSHAALAPAPVAARSLAGVAQPAPPAEKGPDPAWNPAAPWSRAALDEQPEPAGPRGSAGAEADVKAALASSHAAGAAAAGDLPTLGQQEHARAATAALAAVGVAGQGLPSAGNTAAAQPEGSDHAARGAGELHGAVDSNGIAPLWSQFDRMGLGEGGDPAVSAPELATEQPFAHRSHSALGITDQLRHLDLHQYSNRSRASSPAPQLLAHRLGTHDRAMAPQGRGQTHVIPQSRTQHPQHPQEASQQHVQHIAHLPLGDPSRNDASVQHKPLASQVSPHHMHTPSGPALGQLPSAQVAHLSQNQQTAQLGDGHPPLSVHHPPPHGHAQAHAHRARQQHPHQQPAHIPLLETHAEPSALPAGLPAGLQPHHAATQHQLLPSTHGQLHVPAISGQMQHRGLHTPHTAAVGGMPAMPMLQAQHHISQPAPLATLAHPQQVPHSRAQPQSQMAPAPVGHQYPSTYAMQPADLQAQAQAFAAAAAAAVAAQQHHHQQQQQHHNSLQQHMQLPQAHLGFPEHRGGHQGVSQHGLIQPHHSYPSTASARQPAPVPIIPYPSGVSVAPGGPAPNDYLSAQAAAAAAAAAAAVYQNGGFPGLRLANGASPAPSPVHSLPSRNLSMGSGSRSGGHGGGSRNRSGGYGKGNGNMGGNSGMGGHHNGNGLGGGGGGNSSVSSHVVRELLSSCGGANGKEVLTPTDLIGRAEELARDQQGCRACQRAIEEGDPQCISIIFEECYDKFVELTTHAFANYLTQKIFQYCNDDQRLALVKRCASSMAQISTNMHGTRAVQRMVDCLNTPEQIRAVCDALAPAAVSLMCDINGNHVIQKILQRMEPADNQFVYDAVAENCYDLATQRHACCVMQRCMDHATPQQRDQLAVRIIANALALVSNCYSNYVVQYLLGLNIPAYTQAIVTRLQGNVATLSMQKFASNVIEKSLEKSSQACRQQIISELVEQTVMSRLLMDSYANYVIQRALMVAEGEQLEQLCDAIRPHLPALRASAYGKRIQAKLLKRMPKCMPAASIAGPASASQLPQLPTGQHDSANGVPPM